LSALELLSVLDEEIGALFEEQTGNLTALTPQVARYAPQPIDVIWL
jgi:hypothetical protein